VGLDNDPSLIATLDCPNDDDCDTVLDADDNCPGLRTTNISDTDGNGRGDLCECGDQTGDAYVTVDDLVAINMAIFNPDLATPLCDTNDDDQCNVSDIIGANLRIFGQPAYCAKYPRPAP